MANYNALPDGVGVEGGQKRRTDFSSDQEKLNYDAEGLIGVAQRYYGRDIVTVDEALGLRIRNNAESGVDDDVEGLRRAIALKLRAREVPTPTESRAKVNVAPTATAPERLDEAGERKVRALFESPEAGFQGYAVNQLLREANIDPDNLPEGSAPFWESPEAALAELLSNLTFAHLEVIQRDYTDPAIVVEPIRASDLLFVKDESVTNYDRRMVGTTPFFVSEWSGQYLKQGDAASNVGSMDGDQIVGWNIGIVDKAQKMKVLATDGDVNTKKLQDRARDFHAEGGHGSKGFTSAMDHPRLYGLMMNASHTGESPQPIDDVIPSDGVWTMGTRLFGPNAKIYEQGKDDYPRVAGGNWNRIFDNAGLDVNHADIPYHKARVRLAVMFKKA